MPQFQSFESAKSFFALFAFAAFSQLAPNVLAQGFPPIPEVVSPREVERNFQGVNLVTGKTEIDIPVLQVPGSPRLVFDRVQNALPYITGTVPSGESEVEYHSYTVHTGRGRAATFQCVDYDCVPVNGEGALLRLNSFGENLTYVYKEAQTGVVFNFSVKGIYLFFDGQENHLNHPSSVSYPDGEVITYTYDVHDVPYASGFRKYHRPISLSSNTGYRLSISYHSDTFGVADWSRPNVVELVRSGNSAVVARHTYSNNANNAVQITDLDGNQFSCVNCHNQLAYQTEANEGSLQLPGDSGPSFVATRHAAGGVIGGITRGGVSWAYDYTGLSFVGSKPIYDTMSVTGPDGSVRTYEFDKFGDHIRLDAMVDPENRRTDYLFDGKSRLTRIDYPELNREEFDYDIYGNLTEIRRFAKPGSSVLMQKVSAYYPTTDTSLCNQNSVSVRCFRPLWVEDAGDNRTDYQYNNRGQVTQILEPANPDGVRVKKVVVHQQFGAIVRAASETICKETEDCVNDWLTRTEYGYWGSTPLLSHKCVTDKASGTVLVTKYTYDDAGRVLTQTSPKGATGVCP